MTSREWRSPSVCPLSADPTGGPAAGRPPENGAHLRGPAMAAGGFLLERFVRLNLEKKTEQDTYYIGESQWGRRGWDWFVFSPLRRCGGARQVCGVDMDNNSQGVREGEGGPCANNQR